MASHSSIEWTDATWQPITGCSVVSPGCTNCYAMRLAGTRLQHHPSRANLTTMTKAGPVWNGAVRFNREWLTQPLGWRKPRRIFVCAHGDLFHENVPDEWIDRVFAVMALAPQHTFQVLTKRAERMQQYLTRKGVACRWVFQAAQIAKIKSCYDVASPEVAAGWQCEGLPNVWLGISAEDQRRADERIPHLLATPAAVRFVSAEPLLGPIDLAAAMTTPAALQVLFDKQAEGTLKDERGSLHWVIVGGESGPGARPMHPDWAHSIRDQCAAAGVPFFFKQFGNWAPIPARDDLPGRPQMVRAGDLFMLPDGQSDVLNTELSSSLEGSGAVPLRNVGKKAAGRLLDGVEHNEVPK